MPMTRICLYSICILCCFRAPAIAGPFQIPTTPTRDQKVESLKRQVAELIKENERLQRKTPKAPQYRTVTRYRTETRESGYWTYCPTCPSKYRWQKTFKKVRVPYQVKVRVYEPEGDYKQPGVYSHNGREYLWNGRQTVWLDDDSFFREVPRRQFRGVNTYYRKDGRRSGPIATAAKGAVNLGITIPLLILRCLLR